MKNKNSIETDTKHILVVDDETEIRDSLRVVLEDCGYESTTAETGKEAIDKLKEKEFDLVITDIRMPEMGGLDVIEKLRSLDNEVPVLIITAYVYREMAVRAMQMGANGYLLKPLDFDELIHRIEVLLSV